MNERIQQMIYNLNEKVGVHWTNEDKLKFTELLIKDTVQKCCQYLTKTGRHYAREQLERHFGVEE